MGQLRNLIRKNIPNVLVNYGKHLPVSIVSNLRYGFPSKKMKIIGVTGTDGKTTTVSMIYTILKDAGKNVSMVSTINAVIAGHRFDTGFHVTSPSHFQIQKYLRQAYKGGSEYVVLEVTSHALDQFRVFGIKFEVGVVTNITHEHLDYHKSFKNYLKSKARLVKKSKIAILNKDEKHFPELVKLCKGKVVSFGLHKSADFNPIKFPLKLGLKGDFNVLNALAASATCINLSISSKVIRSSLLAFQPLPGRMEEVPNSLGIKIFIDFAHTPNALEKALYTLRKETKGRLISVFGAASERDILKRPIMGKISGKLADITILTGDDPRHESKEKIIEEIAVGVKKAGGQENFNLFKEPDRQKAIKLALKLSKNGDVIGIFGKGHENSISLKGVELKWSDKEAVQKALYGT